MNIFDFEIILIWLITAAMSLTAFIYLGYLFLNIFKFSAPRDFYKEEKALARKQ